MMRALGALCLSRAVWAQQAGTEQTEGMPSMSMQSCSGPGECESETVLLTMDSQRRWLHNSELTNCFEGDDWDGHVCPDPQTCASSCMLEGIEADAYSSNYGVTTEESAVNLKFIIETEWGKNVGARLYALDGEETYKMFHLKNREIAFEVDVSSLPCGLNAALYLVEMPADGGKSSGNGAGAKYGTGYCDAQCPHALKFIEGEANIKGWKGAIGGMYGSCCAEMDLFEANKMAGAFTAHPCSIAGAMRCEGQDCGDADAGHYYQGVCDKDGCDFNPHRLGVKDFYGPGYTVDPQKPFTVVTQFLTKDGSDQGDLAEIRRYFVQDGQVIENPEAKGIDKVMGNSITDAFCAASKEAFHQCRVKNNPNGAMDQFNKMGGLKSMGQSLDRGMALVLSLWDDPASAMHWLDSQSPSDLDASSPGVERGPCPRQAGKAEEVEVEAADAFVRYANIRYGPVGSTTEGVGSEPLSAVATAPMPETPYASAEVSTDGMSGFKKVAPAFDGAEATLPAVETDAAPGPTLAPGHEFACDQGANNWQKDWSDMKKEFCCQSVQVGCVGGARLFSLLSGIAAPAASGGSFAWAGLAAVAAAIAGGVVAARRAHHSRSACALLLDTPTSEDTEAEPLAA